MNQSTNETAPLHIWKHETIMAAIAKGASGESCQKYNDRLVFWYQSGEPVWMAADTLAFLVERERFDTRSPTPREQIRRVLAAHLRSK